METLMNAVTGKAEKAGKRLQKLAKEKDFDSIEKILNKIKVPEGFKLTVHAFSEDEKCGLGAESYAVIITPEGETIPDKEKEFWKLLQVEDSAEGAWQVYLLYNLWHYLPMFWHAYYEERIYVYSSDQLSQTLPHLPRFAEEPLLPFDIKHLDVTPKIFQDQNIWHVGACFWTDFGGLIYEELKINLSGKVHVYAKPARRKTLHHYDCGICF